MLAGKIKARMFIITLIILTPLTNLGTDIYTPSLPAIVNALHAPTSLVKLTLTVYLLSYGIGQLLFGILSDSAGRRTILLIGISSYAAFSLFCAITHSIYLLLCMRLLQGLSASITSVITKSIITDKFKAKRLKTISNYKVLAQILSIIIGPLLGGIIQTIFGWRMNFYFLAIYSMISLILSLFFLGETLRVKTKLCFTIITRNISTIISQQYFVLLILNIAILYGIAALFGVFGPFLIQQTLKISALTYGIVALTCGCCYMLGSLITRHISNYQTFRLSILVFVTIPCILMVIAIYHINSLLAIITPIFFIMAATGLTLPKLMAFALSSFPRQAGSASALLGTGAMIGSGAIIGMASFTHSENAIAMAIFYLMCCFGSAILIMKMQKIKT